MNHVANQKRAGFTLIELMLAMTFLSVLMLAIAMTIIQMGTIYNKGLSVKDVNQIGRSLSDEFSRSASEAAGFSIDRDFKQTDAGGRLCLGRYSYIWNNKGANEANSDPSIVRYASGTKVVRLVKVPDPTRFYCTPNATGVLGNTIVAPDVNRAQELLPEGDQRIGINEIRIVPSSVVTDPTTLQTMFMFEYVVSNGRTSSMTEDQRACLGPSDPNSDLVYCTVVPFNIVLRTGRG